MSSNASSLVHCCQVQACTACVFWCHTQRVCCCFAAAYARSSRPPPVHRGRVRAEGGMHARMIPSPHPQWYHAIDTAEDPVRCNPQSQVLAQSVPPVRTTQHRYHTCDARGRGSTLAILQLSRPLLSALNKDTSYAAVI